MENTNVTSCNNMVWGLLTPQEKDEFLLNQISVNAGKYQSCLARNMGLQSSSITKKISRLSKNGKIKTQHQRMRIGQKVVLVKRIYPENAKLRKINIKTDYTVPARAGACNLTWFLLDSDTKKEVIFRVIQQKPGLTYACLGKRIGIEPSVVRKFVKKLEAENRVSIYEGKKNRYIYGGQIPIDDHSQVKVKV